MPACIGEQNDDLINRRNIILLQNLSKKRPSSSSMPKKKVSNAARALSKQQVEFNQNVRSSQPFPKLRHGSSRQVVQRAVLVMQKRYLCAMSAASMRKVPEPHIGSTRIGAGSLRHILSHSIKYKIPAAVASLRAALCMAWRYLYWRAWARI